MPKVFLITGCSSGFGKEYVEEVLKRGDIAVATARKPESLKFKGANEKNLLALRLDVNDQSSIDKAFEDALKKFGRIDVVCNNAGYGLAGCFEETTEQQIRAQFDTNVFGLIEVTRVAMKLMREQSPPGGVIQQVTSNGGQNGVPIFSAYCGTKWAVEGFTEAVSKEVKPEWGIKFTLVEPGGFRTDWAGRSMQFADHLELYDHMNARELAAARDGKQGGDPVKGAKAMYELAVMQDPPLRCLLGKDAYENMLKKLATYKEQVAKYKDLTLSCQIDE